MLEGLKMGWVFNKPDRQARPSDTSPGGLNTVSPLLGKWVLSASAVKGDASFDVNLSRQSCFGIPTTLMTRETF